MHSKAKSVWRHVTAQLIIAVLLFQAGTVAVHLSVIAGGNGGAALSDLGLNGTVICSEHGLVRIDSQNRQEPVTPSDKPLPCPVCQVIAALSLHLPPNSILPVAFKYSASWPEIPSTVSVASALIEEPRSRGPPASFL